MGKRPPKGKKNGAKNLASKINHLRIPKVILKMRKGKCLRFRPAPGIPWNTGGGFIRVGFPPLRSRRARIDTLNGTRRGARTTLRMVRGRQRRRARWNQHVIVRFTAPTARVGATGRADLTESILCGWRL